MKLSTKLKIVALSLVAAFGAGLVYYANAETIDNTRDCDKYAVVYCGTMSVQEMRERYFNKGVSTIYGAFGISYEMLSGNYANGAVYRNGEVRLDNGTVVATNARTAIRNISGGTPISGTDAKVVPASRMGSAQRAFIRLDEQGRFKFAIMAPCGNPVVATNVVVPPKPKPQPVATCKALDQPVINRQTNTVALKAHATVENGATVKSYTFSITDASGKEVFSRSNTTSALTSETSATIKEAGTYTARVTVTTSLGDRTSNDCVKQFTIQPETPKANPGIKIEKKVDGLKHKTVQVGNEFPYQVTVTNTGNVDLKNAVVTDNAPQGVTFLKASEGTLQNNTWKATIAELKQGASKTFTITATIKEQVTGKVVNTACVDTPEIPGDKDGCDNATVDVPEKVEACNVQTGVIEKVEKGKENTPPYTTDLSKCEKIKVCDVTTKTIREVTKKEAEDTKRFVGIDSEECNPKPTTPTPPTPTALPRTGMTDMVLGGLGLGALVTSALAYVASRRHL